MIPALARFVDVLRREGIHASPAELLDAARAIEVIGLEDRKRFRSALCSTLAKDRRQREIFGRLFDLYFMSPRSGRKGEDKGQRAAAGEGGARTRPEGTETSPTHRSVLRGRPESSRTARPSRDDEEVRRLRTILEAAGRRGPDHVGRLRRTIVHRERPGEGGDRRQSDGGTQDPWTRDITRPLPPVEERDLADRIPRLVEDLRLRKSRRMRSSRRGRLWTRRIFRENISRGGVPFVLPFRRPRRRRPRIVLLVDVSYSAARATGFFLWMASAFVRFDRRTSVLAFVDRVVDATRMTERWARDRQLSQGSFSEWLSSLADLNPDAPSDYGRTFHGLLASRLRPAGRDTVLLILGDGRTNRFEPLSWALEEIAESCRAVIWLIPEPVERWGTGDSALADYLPHADVAVEAWNLEGLATGLGELLRRL